MCSTTKRGVYGALFCNSMYHIVRYRKKNTPENIKNNNDMKGIVILPYLAFIACQYHHMIWFVNMVLIFNVIFIRLRE